MNREQARQEVRRRWREIIVPYLSTGEAKRKANGETSYICPLCGHGKGGDGLTLNPKSKDGVGLKCFGCDFTGDIIDLAMRYNGSNYNQALEMCAAIINITIDPYTPEDYPTYFKPRKTAQTSPQSVQPEQTINNTPTPAETAQEGEQAAEIDNTEYYRQCRARLNDPAAASYLSARGISIDTAAAYWLGFDPEADPAGSGHKAPRIIIPTSQSSYIGRSIEPKMPAQYRKLNSKGGNIAIFNGKAMYAQDVQAVFIVEGAFDALSIIEAGYIAIALNSVGNCELLIKRLQERRTAATFILCLDNDKAGKEAAERLKKGLQLLNISHITADICCGHKDPNEALTADREAFIQAVEKAQRRTAQKPDNTSYYLDNLMTGEIERFKDVKYTGFENLDKKAGGLYAGLYTVAAISSLGKTTFCHQMAEQLAAAGSDVLFFSLEQSRLELVSKSLARRTAQKDMQTAVQSLAIRRGVLPKQVIEAAAEYKKDVQDRLSIIEGNFACNVSFIGDYIRQYIRRTGIRPVCFIDYLQILQPEQTGNRQQGTRETVDNSITELKRLSRELDITIFVVCSVNRANYLTPIDFESLKESGGIEYTSDVVWGLQLQCLHDKLFNEEKKVAQRREKIKEAKRADPRKIELCCLKNRYGIANFSCYFNYYSANDLFTICPYTELDFTPDEAPRKSGKKV